MPRSTPWTCHSISTPGTKDLSRKLPCRQPPGNANRESGVPDAVQFYFVPMLHSGPMVNVAKHIAHWRRIAEESWRDAEGLLQTGRYAFAGYAAHLALEKVLKAHVTCATGDIPPRTHDLVYLAKLCGIKFSEDHTALLTDMNEYQLEGRYPDVDTPAIDAATVKSDIRKAKELFEWLKQQL